MKLKKDWIYTAIFYVITGLFLSASIFVRYKGLNDLACFCFLITGALATIPIYKSMESAKRYRDYLINKHQEISQEIGNINFHQWMDGNPVMDRQPASVAQ